ncbi:kinase-like protein, partial [Acaromyces ingoldii]
MGGLALGDRGGSAGGSGSPRLLGSGAPASVDKSPSSSSAALGLRLGGGGGGNSGGSSSEHQQRHIGSVPDDWPMYSSQPDDYVIGPSIGFGASSTVYQASFRPLNGRACAVKVIDLEAFGRDTDELRRETQLMSLSKHPNVLRVRGCWVEGSKLHIATRLMSSGSMLDIMRFGWSDGFDEIVIATVLRQALEGLNYLHINGWLHRDLKAANMLVDDDGTVLLGDFGVGKENIDEGWAEGKRKSFVGTPCWMAPEVVERKGYGTKADIWSFGITALELTQGRAPYSRLPPVKVLMKTLQEDPPTLDRTGGAHKYSKVFDDFARLCLQKDPTKRPSAEKLLQHGFFRQAKNKKHLVSTVLAGLPPLAERQERRRAMSI